MMVPLEMDEESANSVGTPWQPVLAVKDTVGEGAIVMVCVTVLLQLLLDVTVNETV